jgi:hypothetical protein
MHCWCPPATGPGQPHESNCSHYKRPIIHAHVGSYHDWDLMVEPGPQYTKINPEAWTFGQMTAKLIADAEMEPCGPGEGYPAISASIVLKAGEPGVAITPELGHITKEAVHKVYDALKTGPFGHNQWQADAAAYNAAYLWTVKQNLLAPVAPVPPVELNEPKETEPSI